MCSLNWSSLFNVCLSIYCFNRKFVMLSFIWSWLSLIQGPGWRLLKSKWKQQKGKKICQETKWLKKWAFTDALYTEQTVTWDKANHDSCSSFHRVRPHFCCCSVQHQQCQQKAKLLFKMQMMSVHMQKRISVAPATCGIVLLWSTFLIQSSTW